MTHPPRITDESVLARWMSMEIGKINEGVVRDRKILSRLLDEEIPSATIKMVSRIFLTGMLSLFWEKGFPVSCTPVSGSRCFFLCPPMCLTVAGVRTLPPLKP
jgi:hypothetical protein